MSDLAPSIALHVSVDTRIGVPRGQSPDNITPSTSMKMLGRGNPPDNWDALVATTRGDWNLA